MKSCQELRVCGSRGKLSKPDEISTLWEETLPPNKVVLTRFETGDAVYNGVVTAGVQVSTPNKMVGKARQTLKYRES